MKIRTYISVCQALVAVVLTQVEGLMAAEPAGQPWACHIIDESSRGADGVKLADINGDGLMDIATGWEEGGVTRIYLNPGPDKSKTHWPMATVGKTPSVEDAVFADLDGDGALDVVSCSEGGTKKIYVHWSPRNHADLLFANKWQQAVLPDSEMHSQQWMFAWPMQVDGRNGVDLIAGSKGRNAQIGWFAAPKNGRNLAGYRWHPISQAGWIMSIWKRDMDEDGDIDVVVSDRRGPLCGCRWLENPGYGPMQTKPWKNHLMGAGGKEVLSMVLADLDGDGLQDAVVAVKEMQLFFLKRLDKAGLKWRTHVISADFKAGNTRAVVVADVNGDKQKDLVLTTWNAKAKHGVLWLEYKYTPEDKEWMPHQISGTEKGIKYDRIEMLDLDRDGDLDLLTCEEREGNGGMGVFWYENPHANRHQDAQEGTMKTTILAIGDSITQGGKSFSCYRQVLIPALIKQGLAFEFIGPTKDATSPHAGYGGRNTKYLLSISKDVYIKYPADIVLIHSGHNSFSKDKPVQGIIRDTRAMIETISALNPKVTILLAQVIPAGKLPKYSYIPELNQELKVLSQRLISKNFKVILVNQADGFDWKTDTISDKVHPNASGAKKMAVKWMDALLPLLIKQEKNFLQANYPFRPPDTDRGM